MNIIVSAANRALFEQQTSGRARALGEPVPPYPMIPCVCPGWDNTARRSKEATVFVGSTPERYEHWLSEVVKRQRARLTNNADGEIAPESLVFINAWNEWAEGNHLEPDQKWGRAYLEATRTALNSQRKESAAYATAT